MSNKQEIKYFEKLKKLVVNKFKEVYPGVSSHTIDWSGQDITGFQEDLQEKLNTTISEKWFYTYFKQDQLEKLPRIDMLNLLSQYAGFEDWKGFQQKNETAQGKKKQWLKLPVLIAIVIFGLLVLFFFPKNKSYNFCFVDEDVNLPISSTLKITLLQEGQSPIYLETEENGCFSYITREKSIQFVVSSPYYKSDTITRLHDAKSSTEKVRLSADEYALILFYFSSNKVEDWNERRKELGRIIHDEAIIYQVIGADEIGIDVLSKEAFINKITLPTSSLRNMKIIEIIRDGGQIIKLKFAVKSAYE